MNDEDVKDIAELGFSEDNGMYNCEKIHLCNLINIPIKILDFQIQKVENREPYIFLFNHLNDSTKTDYKSFTTSLRIKKKLDKARSINFFPFKCKVICEKGRFYDIVSLKQQ